MTVLRHAFMHAEQTIQTW